MNDRKIVEALNRVEKSVKFISKALCEIRATEKRINSKIDFFMSESGRVESMRHESELAYNELLEVAEETKKSTNLAIDDAAYELIGDTHYAFVNDCTEFNQVSTEDLQESLSQISDGSSNI